MRLTWARSESLMWRVPFLVLSMCAGVGFGCAEEPAIAWLRFEESTNQQYQSVPYVWLGDRAIHLAIDVAPSEDHVLDLMWGAKGDRRTAQLVVNDYSQSITAGGYDGFRWQRILLPGRSKREARSPEFTSMN